MMKYKLNEYSFISNQFYSFIGNQKISNNEKFICFTAFSKF